MIIEPFAPYQAGEFQVKFATSQWERRQAHALRRSVFCAEQKIFEEDDRDAVDDHAIPIVALSMMGVTSDQLVGTVRIHEERPASGGAHALPCMRTSARSARLAQR